MAASKAKFDVVEDIHAAIRVDPAVTQSLLKQEQRSKVRVEKEEEKHRQLSEEVNNLWNQTYGRYSKLQDQERMLSSQAGQLLNALQREEAVANKLSTCVRKIRHTRKKLLARIQNPRWEVRHHYHMTCLEHVLGHTQPHVMEVGEMVPGHLRLFSFARRSTLFQKSIVFSLTRAKNARNSFSDKIKEVYRELRLTRADIKEVEKLLDAIKEKSHLMPNRPGPPGRPGAPPPGRGGGPDPTLGRSNNPRMRYLHSLNISPTHTLPAMEKKRIPIEPKGVSSASSASSASTASSSAASAEAEVNMEDEWKKVAKLLKDLELQAELKVSAAQELVFLEQCRSRFKLGIDGLPQPLVFQNQTDFIDDALSTMPGESLSSVTSTVPDNLAHSPPTSPSNKQDSVDIDSKEEEIAEPHGDLHMYHGHPEHSAPRDITSIRRKTSGGDMTPRRSSRAVGPDGHAYDEHNHSVSNPSSSHDNSKPRTNNNNSSLSSSSRSSSNNNSNNGIISTSGVSSSSSSSASAASGSNNNNSRVNKKAEAEVQRKPSGGESSTRKEPSDHRKPTGSVAPNAEVPEPKRKGRSRGKEDDDEEEDEEANASGKVRAGTPLGIGARKPGMVGAGPGGSAVPASPAVPVGGPGMEGFGAARRPQAHTTKLSSRAR